MNRIDYTGKKVYMGIDVHKKTYCCVSVLNKEVIRRDSMPAQPEVLLHYIKRFYPNAEVHTAYEAGFSGFHLHRFLADQGINSHVINPASIEVASRDKVKTDKRDAQKIATQLEAGRLQSIFVPSLEREEKRSVTRLRAATLKVRQQIGLRFKSLLYTQGLIEINDDTVLTKGWILKKIEESKQQGYSWDFCYTLTEYGQQWVMLTERLLQINTALKEQAKKDKVLHSLYDSTPGIGAIHARMLANELGDMKQFRNEKQLFSYTGLTPSQHSSGERIHYGHISRQRSGLIRKILIEAAWVAIRKDGSLKEVFDRLSGTRGKKRAIIGVARRLVGRIRSCVQNGTMYEIKSIKETCLLQEKGLHDLVDGPVTS